MKQLAIWTCSAAVLGLISISTETVVSEAGAGSREEYCHRLAKRKSRRTTGPGEAALGAGVGSAVIGAIIGGIAGGGHGHGVGRGALIGGSVGALSGALVGTAKRNRAFNRAFRNCMAAKPTRVRGRRARAYRPAPEPWTPEWYAYCGSKYRSFNPDTGRYLTYSGHYRLCR